ncbi:MAG: hypothetical protein LBV13_06235 [Methanomassiliicoccaceae archaeon]|nr:hypothetical protein [Methanomassiliicoccaceae archaeon]
MVAIVDRAVSAYRKEYEENPVLTLFLTIIISFFIMFVVSVVLTGGDTAVKILFSGLHQTGLSDDRLMDFFNSIMHSSDHPYTQHQVIYPPLATTFYTVIGHFIIPYADALPGPMYALGLRDSQMGMMVFSVITLLTFYALYLIFSKALKHRGARKNLVFPFVILLGYPFIYALERGNNIILALIFCFLFLLGYGSENKFIRYASYVALGIAAGFKIYPAILMLLIARDRKRTGRRYAYKETGICISVVMLLMFVPFIFTDGTPLIFIENVLYYTGSNLGFTNINQIIMGTFQEYLGWPGDIVSAISYTVIGAFTLLSVIVILFDTEMKFWKVIALLSCNLILGLGAGAQYQIIYMAMPILFFLAAEKEMTRENLFYTLCFAMTVVLIPGIYVARIHPPIAYGAIVETVFVIAVTIMLLREGLLRICRNRYGGQRGVECVSDGLTSSDGASEGN